MATTASTSEERRKVRNEERDQYFRQDKDACDVRIVCRDGRVYGHKAVLLPTSILFADFLKLGNVISMPMLPPNIMKIILDYVYFETMPKQMPTNSDQLLKYAKSLGLDAFVEAVRNQIDQENEKDGVLDVQVISQGPKEYLTLDLCDSDDDDHLVQTVSITTSNATATTQVRKDAVVPNCSNGVVNQGASTSGGATSSSTASGPNVQNVQIQTSRASAVSNMEPIEIESQNGPNATNASNASGISSKHIQYSVHDALQDLKSLSLNSNKSSIWKKSKPKRHIASAKLTLSYHKKKKGIRSKRKRKRFQKRFELKQILEKAERSLNFDSAAKKKAVTRRVPLFTRILKRSEMDMEVATQLKNLVKCSVVEEVAKENRPDLANAANAATNPSLKRKIIETAPRSPSTEPVKKLARIMPAIPNVQTVPQMVQPTALLVITQPRIQPERVVQTPISTPVNLAIPVIMSTIAPTTINRPVLSPRPSAPAIAPVVNTTPQQFVPTPRHIVTDLRMPVPSVAAALPIVVMTPADAQHLEAANMCKHFLERLLTMQCLSPQVRANLHDAVRRLIVS